MISLGFEMVCVGLWCFVVCFVVVCVGLWCFVVVCGVLWCLVPPAENAFTIRFTSLGSTVGRVSASRR